MRVYVANYLHTQGCRVRFGQRTLGWYIRALQTNFLYNYCAYGVWDSNARANGVLHEIINTIFQIHTPMRQISLGAIWQNCRKTVNGEKELSRMREDNKRI